MCPISILIPASTELHLDIGSFCRQSNAGESLYFEPHFLSGSSFGIFNLVYTAFIIHDYQPCF